MKLTYIISGINRSVFFENTAQGLRKKGYDVNFILIGNPNNNFEIYLSKNNFKFEVVYLKSWRSYPACIWSIYLLIKKENPDIVHTHLTTANITGLFAARLAGIKLRLFTRHSGATLKFDFKTRIYDWITKVNSQFVIAITSPVRDILLQQGFKDKKIELIHYGFKLQQFQNPDINILNEMRTKYNPKQKFPVIGVISRCVEWKGIQFIIPAFEKLLAKYPDALLCLFNFNESESYFSNLKPLFDKLPELSYIKVAFEENVYELQHLFDVFVHVPIDTQCEAFGQIYVEALAAGTPSVFSMSGVANELIKDKENALVVEHQNALQIYTSICNILEDNILKETIIRNGKESVKRVFDQETYITKIDTFYKNLYFQM